MNILLINVPSRKGKGGFFLPLGLLYAAGIIERCGHKAMIVDPYLDDMELKKFDSGNLNMIRDTIEAFRPSIVGYGGIATSYGRAKILSKYIMGMHPEILQIAGGPLASVYKMLLTKTEVDVVFHGEAETSLPHFLKKVEDEGNFYGTPGISYSDDGRVVTTPPVEQISDLDSIPIPPFHLIDIKRYLLDIEDWLDSYRLTHKHNSRYDALIKRIGRRRYYIPIIASRGCTHRCSFCYRHVRGIRQHSVNYVTRYIKYFKDRYDINGFLFSDELFNPSRQWMFDFCDALDKEKIDIFYLVAGARVDKIDEGILTRLRDTGCISIHYGQESGSDIILREYGKGVTRNQNIDITLLTNKMKIFSLVQLVIGSPSETSVTIDETIRFLKDVDAYQYSLNYMIPLPETPIWKYVEVKSLIKNTEAYLDLVAEHGGSPIVNLTREPDSVWRSWSYRIRNEVKLHLYRKTNPKLYYFYKIFYKMTDFLAPFIPSGVRKFAPKWIKRVY